MPAKYSPRFVNFDECMLLAYSGDISLSKKSVFEVASNTFEKINRKKLIAGSRIINKENDKSLVVGVVLIIAREIMQNII